MNKLFPLAAVVLIAACSTTYTYYDPDKPHRVPEGFRNNYAYDPTASASGSSPGKGGATTCRDIRKAVTNFRYRSRM